MKIMVTTDFLMTNQKEQESNMKWLEDFFKRPITNAVKSSGEVIFFVLDDYVVDSRSIGSRDDFFTQQNIKFDNKKTHQYFSSVPNQKSIEYVKEILEKLNIDIIIGYEFSESTRNIFNAIGIKYIDIWLHPIRYLDDVLFGVSSNQTAINRVLEEFKVNDELFYIYADMLRIQNYKGFKRFSGVLQPNSALFVGQTLQDKAILSENGFLNLLDYKNEFKEIVSEYSKVYYKRHPFVKEGDKDVLRFINRYTNVEIINYSSYNLLASEEIKFVFSLSSSVVHESHIFGKKTQFLFKTIFETYGGNIQYKPIMHDLFTTYFWEKCLSEVFQLDIQSKRLERNISKDKLRDTLSFYWAYRDIDKLESFKKTVSLRLK